MQGKDERLRERETVHVKFMRTRYTLKSGLNENFLERLNKVLMNAYEGWVFVR